ncbi:MAG: hypothetical protein IJ560_04645 [Alphaproteobacteria bacterium]|nr:hypothetical protein [Alphaproteobacteria bacterium]
MLVIICIGGTAANAETCPAGYTDVTRAYPSAYGAGLVKNSAGECVPVCPGAGLSKLRLSNGWVASLFGQKNTVPSLNVMADNVVCHADAVSGTASGALNIADSNGTYHIYGLNPDTDYDCPVYNHLTYSCGDGSGTPPAGTDVMYGSVFSVSDDYGTCKKAGFVPSGWKIGNTVHNLYNYSVWRYDGDQTATVNWVADTFVAIYACNYCGDIYAAAPYTTISYNGTLAYKTASALGCANPYNQTLNGYKLYDAYGRDMGKPLVTGGMKWEYAQSLKLIPDWSSATGDVADSPRVTHNIYYYCDDDATTRIGTGTFGERELVTPSDNYGNCRRTGYVPNGWLVSDCAGTNCATSGTSRGTKALYSYSVWNVTSDQRAVINWVADTFVAIYECNTGTPTADAYKTVTFGTDFTPIAPGATDGPACTAPAGKTFVGYDVLDAYGQPITDNDGNVYTLLYNDGSFPTIKWDFPQTLKLRANWDEIPVNACILQ